LIREQRDDAIADRDLSGKAVWTGDIGQAVPKESRHVLSQDCVTFAYVQRCPLEIKRCVCRSQPLTEELIDDLLVEVVSKCVARLT
jgi:hypothetical protein